MRLLPAKKFRLRPAIIALFAALTVPVFMTIVTVNYVSNDSIVRANADTLIERFRADAIESVANTFNPIKSLVHSAATVGGQQHDFYSDNRSLKYLLDMLVHSDKLVSIYVGMADGSFRQARRINPDVPIQNKLPPDGVGYAYRWIEPSNSAERTDHYVFLDKERRSIGTSDFATNYDPRRRYWYRHTVETDDLVISDPDVFAALGLIGFTVGAPIKVDGKTVGVAAADLTLEGLSQYLAERKISPGTLSFILDSQGGVLANSELAKTYANDDGRVELKHISSLDNVLPAIAFSSRPRNSSGSYTFSHGGKRYVASCSPLPVQFGKRWQLFIVTPLSDFVSQFDANNNRLLWIGLTAIGVQLLVIYLLSRVLSSPLERLAVKIDQIEHLSAQTSVPVRSPIAEISVLSKAIDTLDVTVKAFTAFVPVGLVRQLLSSDQKLELGGHSQFLTVFFSDLEAFSTLSEEIPTQELMSRVSAYFEIVTHAVDEEAGTIDKFIGDGVMAFWGAPTLLEDHAWRACLTALRIRRRMELLNRRWQDEGLKPLKIRIGIHSDAVLVGNIGSRERMGYTVIGDGVNIAARLEGLNKEYETSLCISHSVYKETGERLCVRPIDDVVVRGRRARIPIYELLGAYGADPELEPNSATVRLCNLTRQAHDARVRGDVALAVARYHDILADYPGDTVSRQLVARLTGLEPPRPTTLRAAAK